MTLIINVSFQIKKSAPCTITYTDNQFPTVESIRSWYNLPKSTTITLSSPSNVHIKLTDHPHTYCYGSCNYSLCHKVHLSKSYTSKAPPQTTTTKPTPSPKHKLDDDDEHSEEEEPSKATTKKQAKTITSSTPTCDLYNVDKIVLPRKVGIPKVWIEIMSVLTSTSCRW